jgi:hypothetical protein
LLAAARVLLGTNFSLDYARADLFIDSYPGSPLGEDWDFGLDVALNLAGRGSALFPAGAGPPLGENDHGRKVGLGVSMHDPGFEGLLAGLPQGAYFFAMSKPDRRFPGGLSYYHNGILIRTGSSAWLYHATRRAGVHRLDLLKPSSLDNFRRHFPPIRNHGERRIVLAAAPAAACPPQPPGGTPVGGPLAF